MSKAHDEKRDETINDFQKAVNMTAKQLENWLDTEKSKEVGQKKGGEGESTGHESGRRIIKILAKDKSAYTDADNEHMTKVVSYIHRHSAQRPDGDVEETPWRYSLMNWGHDPLKAK